MEGVLVLHLLLLSALITAGNATGLLRVTVSLQSAPARMEKWIVDRQDIAFDVQVVALAEEAVEDIQAAAGIPHGQLGAFVIQPAGLVSVQSLLPHIIAAGHAREEKRKTVASLHGRSVEATEMHEVASPYVQDGIQRTRTILQARGDRIELKPQQINLSSTQVRMKVQLVPDDARQSNRLATVGPAFVVNRIVASGESLVLVLRASQNFPNAAPEVDNLGSKNRDLNHGLKLFIVTPRRIPKGSMKPRFDSI